MESRESRQNKNKDEKRRRHLKSKQMALQSKTFERFWTLNQIYKAKKTSKFTLPDHEEIEIKKPVVWHDKIQLEDQYKI